MVCLHQQVSKPAPLTMLSQLVNKDSNNEVARSHSKIRSSFFRKPRDMSLDISETISHAVDTVFLTFVLVWRERKNERTKESIHGVHTVPPLSLLPGED